MMAEWFETKKQAKTIDEAIEAIACKIDAREKWIKFSDSLAASEEQHKRAKTVQPKNKNLTCTLQILSIKNKNNRRPESFPAFFCEEEQSTNFRFISFVCAEAPTQQPVN
jgi:hypothetical protein